MADEELFPDIRWLLDQAQQTSVKIYTTSYDLKTKLWLVF